MIYVRIWKKLFEQLSDYCRSNVYSRSVMNAIARPVRGKLWVACYQEIMRSMPVGGSEENRQNGRNLKVLFSSDAMHLCSTIRNVDVKNRIENLLR